LANGGDVWTPFSYCKRAGYYAVDEWRHFEGLLFLRGVYIENLSAREIIIAAYTVATDGLDYQQRQDLSYWFDTGKLKVNGKELYGIARTPEMRAQSKSGSENPIEGVPDLSPSPDNIIPLNVFADMGGELDIVD